MGGAREEADGRPAAAVRLRHVAERRPPPRGRHHGPAAAAPGRAGGSPRGTGVPDAVPDRAARDHGPRAHGRWPDPAVEPVLPDLHRQGQAQRLGGGSGGGGRAVRDAGRLRGRPDHAAARGGGGAGGGGAAGAARPPRARGQSVRAGAAADDRGLLDPRLSADPRRAAPGDQRGRSLQLGPAARPARAQAVRPDEHVRAARAVVRPDQQGVLALFQAPVAAVADARRREPGAPAGRGAAALSRDCRRGVAGTTGAHLVPHHRVLLRPHHRRDDRVPQLHRPRGARPRLLLPERIPCLRPVDGARDGVAHHLGARLVPRGSGSPRVGRPRG